MGRRTARRVNVRKLCRVKASEAARHEIASATVTTMQRVRFTATEYTRMASILAGRRTELIDGEIIEMAPIGTAYLLVVDRLERHLARRKAEGRLQSGQPVRLRDYDEPQPDLTILHAPLGLRKPAAADCRLLIEVSDSTYTTDTTVKVPRYLA